jgi:hypothetical protein
MLAWTRVRFNGRSRDRNNFHVANTAQMMMYRALVVVSSVYFGFGLGFGNGSYKRCT